MKVGVNARFLLKGRLEGIGWFCHEVIRRMVARYPQHQFVLFFDRPYHDSFVYGSNVKPVVVFPPARHPLLWYWWFEHSLPAALEREGVDVFISMDGFLSLHTGIPQYLVVHDLAYAHYPEQVSPPVRWFYRRYTGRYVQKAEKIFAVSEATRNDIIRQFGTAAEKISVCYNGVRGEFRPLPEDRIREVRNEYSDGQPYFLFVGALHPRKNVHGLIRAFSLFKTTTGIPMKLLIAGRKAWQTREIEQAYRESAFQQDIRFLDHLYAGQLALITGAAYAAVAPSFLEGFGVPVLEALSSGVPVICSDRFSLPEVAGPGAVQFNPDDLKSMAEAIREICREDQRDRRIQEGLEHSRQFSWEHTTDVICKTVFRNDELGWKD